jgi:hypothetical protein
MSNLSILAQSIGGESVTMDSVTVAMLDDDIANTIASVGVFVTIERAASAFAIGTDRFYRTVLAVGASQGVYRIDPKESGKFDGQHPIVKTILSHVSESTTAARKYASEVLNLAWSVTALGLDPFGFASVGDLRKACKPVKATDSKPEQDLTATTAIDAAVVAQASAEAEAEAAYTAWVEAEAAQMAKAEAEAAQTAKAEAEAAQAADAQSELLLLIDSLQAENIRLQAEIVSLKAGASDAPAKRRAKVAA